MTLKMGMRLTVVYGNNIKLFFENFEQCIKLFIIHTDDYIWKSKTLQRETDV